MSFLGERNAIALGVSQHAVLGSGPLLTQLSPSLLLQFAGAQTMDPRITFTRSTTATYFNQSGVLSTAAINEPRFDYNPVTLAPLGLLIEESRTNLFTYSEQFANAAWTKTNATITANTIAAPDGTTTADTIDEGTANALHRIQQATVTFVSGLSYTFSVFVKNGDRNFVQLFLSPQFSTSDYANFDVSTGVLGTVGGAAVATITDAGNGWYRCSVTATATSAGTSGPSIGLITSSTSARGETYLGTNKFLYLWGAQLEAGAFATSYIPTVASQVTRAADSAVMTGTNFSDWYNAVEGSLYSEASSYDVSAARVGFGISDNTASNQIQTGHGSGARGFISAGGVTQMTQALASVTFSNNTASKVSLAYELNNGNAAANGTIGTLDTAMTIPTVTQARIGGLTASLLPLNGHVRRIAYYPRRLTDAELQGITS